MATATKKSTADEMQAEIESLHRAQTASLAKEDELENKLVAAEAVNSRLLEKRADLMTDEVVVEFIKKKAAEYDPSKVVRGQRVGPGAMRTLCHLYNQLVGAIEQHVKESGTS